GLPASILLRGVLTFAFFGADAYLPLALIGVRGTSAIEAGLVITVATLSWTAGSWIQANRNPVWGPARLVQLGFGVVFIGVGLSALILLPSVPIGVAIF